MKFTKIDTQEKFDGWHAFAKTFGHETDKPGMPLVSIINDRNQDIGYYGILTQPVIFPAFHPTISKREFRDAVELISNHYCMLSMGGQYPHGAIYTVLPKDLPVNHSAKLGFTDLGTLYRRLG